MSALEGAVGKEGDAKLLRTLKAELKEVTCLTY
jgi:hypothetical protein